MRTHVYKVFLFFLFITVGAFAARILDTDQLRSSNRSYLWTLPAISSGTLVLSTGTQTLTNKDYDGGTASNTSRLTLPKAAKTTLDALTRKQGNIMYDTTSGKPYYDTGSVLKPVGSGSGGEKNYLTDYNNNTGNGDIELGATTGWALGHGAVDSTTKMLTTATFGSGASGNLSIGTVGGSSALAGSYSLSYTSSAATTAGDFLASDAFTIDPEDKAKPLRFQFNYMVASGGTFATWSGSTTNSFQVALYDVTNSQLIQPSGNASMTTSSGSLSGMGFGEFQTSASGTQYRLIVYNANATTGAIQINFDSFKVGLNPKVYGSPITDSVVYSGTLLYGATAATNITTQTYHYKREGDVLVGTAYIKFNGAANANGNFNIPLPSGLSIDTTKLSKSDGYAIVGSAEGYINAKVYHGDVRQAATSTTLFQITRADDSGATDAAWAGNTTAGSNIPGGVALTSSDLIQVNFRVPITGWSSSVQMSDSADTRVVAAIYTNTSSQAITSGAGGTTITSWTLNKDTHSAFNPTTGIFTVPVSGYYEVEASLLSTNIAWTTAANARAEIALGGSNSLNLYLFPLMGSQTNYIKLHGAGTLYYTAGQTISLTLNNNLGATYTLNGSGSYNWISIKRVSSSEQIAASETVSARYTTNAGQSISNGATSIVDFEDISFDSHGSVTTGASWRFTANISGTFKVTGKIRYANNQAWTQGSAITAQIFKNGSTYSINETMIDSTFTPVSIGPTCAITDTVKLLAGEYIDFRTSHAESSARTLLNIATYNRVTVERIGNY